MTNPTHDTHFSEIQQVIAALVPEPVHRVAVIGRNRHGIQQHTGKHDSLEGWQTVSQDDSDWKDQLLMRLSHQNNAVVDLIRSNVHLSKYDSTIRKLLSDAAPGATFAFILPYHSLLGGSSTSLKDCLVANQVEWIIWHSSAVSTINWSFLLVRAGSAANQITRIVDSQGLGSKELVSEILRCRSRSGGEVGRTAVLRKSLPIDAPWSWERLSRSYDLDVDDVEALGPLRPLGDFVDIKFAMVGRPELQQLGDEEAIPEGSIPVFQGRSISQDGRLETPTAYIPVARVKEGDTLRAGDVLCAVVVRSHRPLRIACVEPDHLPSVATNSLLRLRFVDALNEAHRDLLVAYLRSRQFARVVATACATLNDSIRITPTELTRALVPDFNTDLLAAMERARSAQRQFQEWANQLVEQRRRLLDADRYRNELPGFLARSRLAFDQVLAAIDVDTLGGRIRQRFPHPIALRRERILQMEPSNERVREILECAEHLIQLLAFLGLLNVGTDATTSLRAWAMGRGNLSIDWGKADSLLRESAAKSANAPNPLKLPIPELATLHRPLSDRNSQLSLACKSLMDARNDLSHLRRGTPEEVAAASETLFDQLDHVLEASSLLTQTPLVEVDDYKRDPVTDEPTARLAYLVGVSPAFARRWQVVSKELTRSHVGIIDAHGDFHSLYPWLMRRTCEKCKHAETFILSQFDTSQTRYVAMESGHALTDRGVANALSAYVSRHDRTAARD